MEHFRQDRQVKLLEKCVCRNHQLLNSIVRPYTRRLSLNTETRINVLLVVTVCLFKDVIIAARQDGVGTEEAQEFITSFSTQTMKPCIQRTIAA